MSSDQGASRACARCFIRTLLNALPAVTQREINAWRFVDQAGGQPPVREKGIGCSSFFAMYAPVARIYLYMTVNTFLASPLPWSCLEL
ncbi:hypothetical protein FOMPIDRAFT_159608, partial [Fomitopsis schrenkii]